MNGKSIEKLMVILEKIKKQRNANKNYMSIGVWVRPTKFAARNNCGVARQESNPQSRTAYSSELW